MVLPSPTSCSVLHFNLEIPRDSLQRIVPCDIIARLRQLDSSLRNPHTLVCFMQNHDSAASDSSVSLRCRNLSPSSFLGLTTVKPFPPVAFHSWASRFQLNLHFHKLEPLLSRVFAMEAPFLLSPLVALICLHKCFPHILPVHSIRLAHTLFFVAFHIPRSFCSHSL